MIRSTLMILFTSDTEIEKYAKHKNSVTRFTVNDIGLHFSFYTYYLLLFLSK